MTTLSALLNEREPQSPLGFDVETDPEGFPICFSIAWGATIEQSKCFWMNEVTLPCQELEDATLVTHYGRKVDVPAMAKVGQQIRISIDTYAAARLKLWDKPKGFSLKDLCKERLGIEEYGDVESLLAKYGLMRGVPRDILEKYNRLDAVNVWRLWHEDLKRYFVGKRLLLLQAESTMMNILADIQNVGIGFDKNKIGEIQEDLKVQAEQLAAEIDKFVPGLAGLPPDSQGAEIEKLLTPWQAAQWPRVKKGRLSIKQEYLNRFQSFHPVLSLLLNFASLRAARSGVNTYAGAVQADGRIHSYLDSWGSSTGRFSSSGPNLQNCSKTVYGAAMRKAFVARPGYCLVECDFKTIQLAIMAVVAEDVEAMKIFSDPKRDFHREIAEFLYGRAVTKEERAGIKAVNFGKAFSPAYPAAFLGFAGGDWGRARELQEKWYEKLPGIKRWHQWVLWEGAKINFTESFYGRKVPIETVDYWSFADKKEGFRVLARRSNSAANHPIQSGEADIAKLSLMQTWDALQEWNKTHKPVYIVLNVHDSLLFEVPDGDLDMVIPLIVERMTHIPFFPIPIFVDVNVGKNWYDMCAYEKRHGDAL